MKSFTLHGLATYIEEITGLECFIMERPRIDEPHIVLEFLSNDVNYADNVAHLYQVEFRAIYGCRQGLDILKINDVMVRKLNATASTGYDEEGEWHMVDYDFLVWLKDE